MFAETHLLSFSPVCYIYRFVINSGSILGYEMYLRGQQFYSGDGLVTKGADNTIRNIGRLGKEGMVGTNDEIIKIMIE